MADPVADGWCGSVPIRHLRALTEHIRAALDDDDYDHQQLSKEVLYRLLAMIRLYEHRDI